MSSGKAYKRPRVEDDAAAPPTLDVPHVITHDPQIWLDDGNIVLVAQDSVAFRFYRGILASQSQVFRDMFGAPHTTVDEHIEECPVVRVSDSPGDLRRLLRVLLPKVGNSHWVKPGRSVPFETLFAVTRLSHKYQFEELLENCRSALKALYPKTLKVCWRGFDIRRNANAIGAVVLARLTDTSAVLPAAMYRCCLLQDDIVDGWVREDGSSEHLSASDLKNCLRAQRFLAQAKNDVTWACARIEPVADCESHVSCREVLEDIRADLELGVEDEHLLEREEQLCDACYVGVDAIEREHAADVWRSLPGMFDLPGW